jgi:hypothetical protein
MHALVVALVNGKQRRCDASCWNATKPECHCICGGALHGVGVEGKQHLVANLHRFPTALPGLDVQMALFA